MNNWAAVVAILCVGLFATIAHAQQPPTDTDLKAAYCIGVLQQEIAQMPQDIPASAVQSQQEQIRHLQSYVIPRTQYIDPLGLAVARTRGQNDAKVLTDPQMQECSLPCATQPNADALKQCVLSCDTQHRLPRMWACNDLSWLPF
ncbi:hypothetical protein ACT2FY_32325 [Paraburkholderia fungorum]|uniref:hypothetical protein n=1 Tax=Paraburkholderia fungorum TaxID=134537 RepID=UPI00402B78C5